jgi:hypothetical protein
MRPKSAPLARSLAIVFAMHPHILGRAKPYCLVQGQGCAPVVVGLDHDRVCATQRQSPYLSWPKSPIRLRKVTHTVALWQDHCLQFQGERQAMNSSPLSIVRHSIESVYQAAKQRLRQWTKPRNHRLALNAASDQTRSKSKLMLENMLLRRQLIVL